MTVGASGVKIKILHLTLMSKWGGKMGGGDHHHAGIVRSEHELFTRRARDAVNRDDAR